MGNLRWEDLTTKERWRYVNQDYVREYELIPKGKIGEITDSTLCGVDFDNPIKLRETVIGLYKDGKETDEIAYHVPCSIRHIQRILEEYKTGPPLKTKIIELHKQGLSKKKIIFKLQCTIRYIDKVLKENFTT